MGIPGYRISPVVSTVIKIVAIKSGYAGVSFWVHSMHGPSVAMIIPICFMGLVDIYWLVYGGWLIQKVN